MKIFIQENASGNIVCEMTAILSRGRGVNGNSRYNADHIIADQTTLTDITLMDLKHQD